jgi:hypothetical protein
VPDGLSASRQSAGSGVGIVCRAVYPAYAQTLSGFTEFLFATSYTLSTLQNRGDTLRTQAQRQCFAETFLSGSRTMNLVVWLPLMFVLGLGSLVLCVLFVDACERI